MEKAKFTVYGEPKGKGTEILINQVNTIAFQINPDDKGLDAIILSA